jgi:riboflavin synthase
MFTGIIQAVGTVADISFSGKAARLFVETPAAFGEDVNIGDSIAVDGVCLTVKEMGDARFAFDVSRESLDCTIIGKYKPKTRVNLEKALRLSDRLGGHIVQGHVDAMGSFAGKKTIGENVEMDFEIPKEIRRYIVEKGSICIDGISLTIARITGNRITVALIPHTLVVTNLSGLAVNAPINIECDIIAKYTENLLLYGKETGITTEYLKDKGFL